MAAIPVAKTQGWALSTQRAPLLDARYYHLGPHGGAGSEARWLQGAFFLTRAPWSGLAARRSDENMSLARTADKLYNAKVKPYGLRSGTRQSSEVVRDAAGCPAIKPERQSGGRPLQAAKTGVPWQPKLPCNTVWKARPEMAAGCLMNCSLAISNTAPWLKL